MNDLGVRATGLTHLGRVREKNEDAFTVDARRGVFLVADGLSGRVAADTASRIVADTLPAMLAERLRHTGREDEAVTAVRESIVELSEEVRSKSTGRPGLAAMGSTVVLACLAVERALVAHMGDSRAYLYRDGRLEQLTEDHTVFRLLLERGAIHVEELSSHPARHMLSRYVGMANVAYPDVRVLLPKEGDRVLLCSDGLTEMVPEDALSASLRTAGDTAEVCRGLIDAANAAGGRDNVTAVVIDWVAAGD